MQKDSFTIFETLLSLSLLALIISGFLKISFLDDNKDKIYMLLNSLENRFDTNNLSNFNKSVKTLKIITNDTEVKYINVNQYDFTNQSLKLIKYEK